MTKPALALAGLCLWLLTPGTVHASPRAFDFSPGGRSTSLRLTSTPSAWTGMVDGNRLRALNHDRHTSDELGIPTHVWLVPLVLTGAGFVLGIGACAAREADCGKSILGGLVVGATLGLGYLELLADLEEDVDAYSGCVEGQASCRESRAQQGPRSSRKAQLASSRSQLTLPLGLTPTVARVHDSAVLGLGARF